MANKEEIIKKLQEAAPKGKITCTAARKIAGEFEIKLSEIGALCDEAKVKICACELGCF